MTNLTVRPATQSDLGTIVDFNARLALETEGLLIDREILEQGVGRISIKQNVAYMLLINHNAFG